MKLKANGKINLTLDIIGTREDGYHLLKSVFLPIALSDDIILEILPNGNRDIIEFVNAEDIPTENNTIVKTLNLMRYKFAIKEFFKVKVIKNIPSSSGLGGGSSDAAQLIIGLNKLLRLRLSKEEMIEIAKEIGADVPFFIINKPAIVEGIGEKIMPISKIKTFVLLVKPKKGVDTKSAYETYDKFGGDHGDFEKLIAAYKGRKLSNIGQYVYNSLESGVFKLNPQIETIKKSLISENFPVVLMSGAGSTVFALTRDKNKAIKTLENIDRNIYDAWLTTTI
ncbi:MAG: 4-(cytidine 5'-diphospho)-2-C-methyl-D-erythritol kinase [Bacilli bacterium]|jgi:4-diphosphocytidyl-2-C-methyl-D-erythritol kinase